MGLTKWPPWLPHAAPYVAFLAILSIAGSLPREAAAWLLPARVAVPLALFIYFLARGRIPELRGFRPGAAVLLDGLVGLAVAALWVAPYLAIGALPRPATGEGFDPVALGERWRGAILALRLAGFALVTPFVEELFVRSFLLRQIDAPEAGDDFRDVPIGRFRWKSFLATVAYFTLSHARWEWPVAAATGIAYNVRLYRRRHIGALVVVHAVTNLAIFLFVALGSGKIAGADGRPLDLWFFL